MKHLAPLLLALFLLLPLPSTLAQSEESRNAVQGGSHTLELPQDLRTCHEQVLASLEKSGYEADAERRPGGIIVTKEQETTSGAYADSELRKIAKVKTDLQTVYRSIRVQLEIELEFRKPQVTAVQVSAMIRALRRSADGKETWETLTSNGSLEKRFLNELSIAVTGRPAFEKEMPYWKRSSQEIPIKK